MATPAYVGELQQTSQAPAGAVTVTPGQPVVVTTAAPQQYLSELQNTVTSVSGSATSGQVTPPPAQTPPTQAPPTQTQYVPAEMQNSPTQSSNAQNTPQYIVVTVTGELPYIKQDTKVLTVTLQLYYNNRYCVL